MNTKKGLVYKMNNNLENLESMPVKKAVLTNAIPAMLAMLMVLIYNMADLFFIGQTGDDLKVAAVSYLLLPPLYRQLVRQQSRLSSILADKDMYIFRYSLLWEVPLGLMG